ncbi:MAG: response regulator transcription factor [Flavobacteriales bacterium]|nr:response regulator transcription factor [Flavobacteriales bacterium]
MPVRVLFADQSELALIGLRSIFKEVPRVRLVGEARDPIELQALLVREKPDVVLIDHTAKGFGPDVIRDGLLRSKRTRFVAITPDPSRLALVNALRGGVTSYIKKDCDVQEIIDAVLMTADGEKFFCGQIIEAIERASIDVRRIIDAPLTCEPVTITKREAEIIALIAEGGSYTRIADRLNLSAHTVKTHRKKIMQKLGVNSTAGLVLYAVKNGLVSPNHFLFNG